MWQMCTVKRCAGVPGCYQQKRPEWGANKHRKAGFRRLRSSYMKITCLTPTTQKKSPTRFIQAKPDIKDQVPLLSMLHIYIRTPLTSHMLGHVTSPEPGSRHGTGFVQLRIAQVSAFGLGTSSDLFSRSPIPYLP